MKIYLGGPWRKQSLCVKAKAYLQSRGLDVVSTWTEQADTNDPQELARNAKNDWRELCSADVLVLLLAGTKSEGKATELGGALMAGKRVIMVGPRYAGASIFTYLPIIEHVDALGQAADLLLQESFDDLWAV